MANDYFDEGVDWTELARGDLARAEDVNDIAQAVQAAFEKLPTPTDLIEGRVYFIGTCGGTVNAYTCVAPDNWLLEDGSRLRGRVGDTNTGPATLNPSAAGAIPITTFAGDALVGGEMPAGADIDWVYHTSGASFRIATPLVSIGSVVVNNRVFVRQATDTTPGDLETKFAPAGRIKERITAAAGDARYQLKLRHETRVTANGTTVGVGTITPVLSAAALTAISLPGAGAGDTTLEDGDECWFVDEGEAIETYPIVITGNAGNINFRGAGAAATLNWNGPNGSMVGFRWNAADTTWYGKGYD